MAPLEALEALPPARRNLQLVALLVQARKMSSTGFAERMKMQRQSLLSRRANSR